MLSDPHATRRAGIMSQAVQLADGNFWEIAKPTLRLIPALVAELDTFQRSKKRIEVYIGYGFPLHIQHLLDEFWILSEAGSKEEQYKVFFDLAISLIGRAHSIDVGTACELFSVSELDLPRVVNEVLTIATESSADMS